MSVLSIIESLGKMASIATFYASIAYIRRFEELRAYLRLKAVAEQGALRTGNCAHLLVASKMHSCLNLHLLLAGFPSPLM